MSLVNAETGEIVEPSLAECEAVIERGIQTFIEVGEALAAIRDNDLFRETHETFEDYCRDRWGFHRQHAWRLIEASEIVGMLPASPIGDAPVNEAQVRELAPLKENPGEMAAAWNQAQRRALDDNRKLTARDVRDAVQQRTEPEQASVRSEDPRDPADAPVDGVRAGERNASSPQRTGSSPASEALPVDENPSQPDPPSLTPEDVMAGALADPDEIAREKLGRKAAQLHDQYGTGLLALDPRRVAQTIDPEERIIWRQSAEQSAAWWTDLLDALGEDGNGLRLVNGGKS